MNAEKNRSVKTRRHQGASFLPMNGRSKVNLHKHSINPTAPRHFRAWVTAGLTSWFYYGLKEKRRYSEGDHIITAGSIFSLLLQVNLPLDHRSNNHFLQVSSGLQPTLIRLSKYYLRKTLENVFFRCYSKTNRSAEYFGKENFLHLCSFFLIFCFWF